MWTVSYFPWYSLVLFIAIKTRTYSHTRHIKTLINAQVLWCTLWMKNITFMVRKFNNIRSRLFCGSPRAYLRNILFDQFSVCTALAKYIVCYGTSICFPEVFGQSIYTIKMYIHTLIRLITVYFDERICYTRCFGSSYDINKCRVMSKSL